MFFHRQGLGKAAMLSASKPSSLIKKEANLLTYIIPLLILDLLICVLSGAAYFTATVER